MNKIDLSGRRAVITGGAQGIGFAIAQRLLESGAAVCLWDLDQEALRIASSELISFGRVEMCAMDVTNANAVEAAGRETVRLVGGIDILVTSAGITGPNSKSWEYPIHAWQQVVDVNLNGLFYCCRTVIPQMINQQYGKIVSIFASVAGKEGNPNASAYSASKAGVIIYKIQWARSFAVHNIAVNCITPAAAHTGCSSE